MITSNLYSMSVKELCARLSVLLVMFAFTVSAKAELTVVKRATNKYTVVVDGADQIKNWTLPDSLSEIVDLRIETTSGVQLSKAEVEKLCNQGPGNNNFLPKTLNTLDFSTAELNNIDSRNNEGPNPNPLKVLNAAPENIKNFILPTQDGMYVPGSCFADNQKIESVIIPDNKGTYTLGSQVFASSSIKKAGIGKGTDSLGGTYSTNIYDADGQQIFANCSNLYSVVLTDDIKMIKPGAFSHCTNLEFVKLPNSLETICGSAFEYCSAMKTVVIPATMRNWGNNAFGQMDALTDVYLLGSNIPLPVAGADGGAFNVNQTTNFQYKGHNDSSYEPKFSQEDYYSTNAGSDYKMCILHYPATEEAVANYRWNGATSNKNIDPDGTTWPDDSDIDRFWTAADGFDRNDQFIGWKYFLQGVQNEKRDDIVPDPRYKESRWYSVCYPFDVTEDKFYSAFGPRAALSEFSGMVIDEKSNNMTLKFTQAAAANNEVILKKNHAYMIHPDKICTDEDPITIYNVINELEHYRHSSVVGTLEGLKNRLLIVEQQIEQYGETEERLARKAELEVQIETEYARLHALNILTDEEVDEFNDDYNATVWDHTKAAADGEEATESRIRRFPDRDGINFYFKGNYIDNVKLPAYCYYLGGSLADDNYGFYFRKKEGSKWTRFSAILVPEANTTPTGAKDIGFVCLDDAEIVNEEGNAATAIDNTIYVKIPMNNANNAYNMQGQMVGTNGTKGLAKGMYIVNGKKIVIK